MSEKLPGRLRLNPTRVFLIVFVLLALGLAVTTILSSLGGWERSDADISSPEAR